jgi:feruloyl-CoA synthase
MQAAREICADANMTTPDEILRSKAVTDFVRERLVKHNKGAGGSSGKVARIMLMTEPPSIDGHEITDKGYVNQRATLERRAKLLEALYAKAPPSDVIVV